MNFDVHVWTAVNATISAAGLSVLWCPSDPGVSRPRTLPDGDFYDTGTFTIQGANNPPATSQSLNLARYNEVVIAGGLVGSRMRVTVEANVSYPVQ